jgi:single-strand DNA-binding protein
MNLVVLSGRITRDINIAYMANTQQTAVAKFTVALDRGKDKNGENRGADFPNCVAFGKTAENLEKFSGKGLRVQVTGHLQTGSYEKDGVKHYTTDVIADRVEFIDWKTAEGSSNATQQEAMPDNFEAIDEDVPF